MSRLLPILVTVCALTFASSALGGVEIRGVDVSGYPVVRATVVAPTPSQQPPSLEENGQAVAGFEAQNLARAKSVVLAVDSSRSMKGQALEDATAAARAFIGAKPPADRIAVVTFGHEAVVVTSFSTSTIDADTALRTLGIDDTPGTALYDAIVLAARSLAADPLPARVIIVLTDGKDISSKATLEEAVAAANDAGAAVYPIAIEGPQFSPEPLEQIAAETGGTYYGAASSEALGDVYTSLGEELKRTWQLEYVTAARPGERLELETVAGGETATAEVVAPGAAVADTRAEPSKLLPKELLESSWGPKVFGLVVGLVILVAALLALAQPKGSWVRARLRPHTTATQRDSRPRAERDRLAAAAALFLATERALGRRAFWQRIQLKLQRSDLPLRTVEFLYLMAGTGLGFGFVAAIAGVSSLWILAAMAVGAFLPYAFASFRARRRLKAFENQLPDLLVTMAASLKAGHSFRQGMQTVVDEGADPAAKEFKRVLTETQLGRPMDEALGDMAERVGSKNLEFVVTSVNIQRTVGGSLAGLFDMVAETVRNRQQFARKIKGLTAMGRASAYVLIGLPFFVALLVTLVNAEYMQPLYHSSTGHKLIFLGLAMMAVGSAILKKIVSFRG